MRRLNSEYVVLRSSFLLLPVLLVVSMASLIPAKAPGPPRASSAPPQPASSAQSLGAVRPSNLVLPQLGISTFDGGDVIGQTVQTDLTLGDVATKPSNPSGAAAAAAQDRQLGAVNYDGWTAAGVNYVLRGALSGGGAQAELYDIASKQRIFGNSYSGASAQGSRLAHKIADDIMKALTGQPGIFSTQICYLVDRGRNKEVGVMDADGGNERTITNENSIVATPCWGLNGAEIYFTSYRDNNPDLYGITLNGRRFEISRRPGLNTSPAWNAARQRIAVTLSKDGNPEIYTMTRDGRDPVRLTNSPDAETAAEWSPDGSQIAYTADGDGQPGIYIMSAGGGGGRKISGSGYFDSASWSPDGHKIAFVAREKGEFNIYVADLTGGATVQLTHGQGDNKDPSWGPDSKHLVYSSTRSGGKQIFMMNTDTKVAHQLSRGGGCTSPSWGPVMP